MKPKPFWLLNHFTIPVFIEISFHCGCARGTWRISPRFRFVDFGEVSEACAPASGEAKRPSRSAKVSKRQPKHEMALFQGKSVHRRIWPGGIRPWLDSSAQRRLSDRYVSF